MGGTGATAVMNVPRVTVMGADTDDEMGAATINNEGVDTLVRFEVVSFPTEQTATLTRWSTG